jgi:hypothetical protein
MPINLSVVNDGVRWSEAFLLILLDVWSKAQRIDMLCVTNIYLSANHVDLKGRTDCVSFAATFRILIRLNVKAPPFEREHLFTRNVQWTCFTILDIFKYIHLFAHLQNCHFMATRKEQVM